MMKTMLLIVTIACLAFTSQAEPARVILLDFEDQTGMTADRRLGGVLDREQLASKGIYLTAEKLLEYPGIRLIDRRDFMAGLRESDEMAGETAHRVSRLEVARALNADILVRGSLTAFSEGRRIVRQGGHEAEFTRVSLRVVLEALDVVDGAIVAIGSGRAAKDLRQTASLQTVLGEDDILELFDMAVSDAVPSLTAGLEKRLEALQERGRVKLTVETTDDPAMVEINGVLVGTTPLEELPLYPGDHLIRVSRAGYETIRRRIMVSSDMKVTVPMLRTDLTVEERRDILQSADMRIFIFDGKPDVLIQKIE